MRNIEKHAHQYKKYQRYFESLGGTPITTLTLPEGTAAIGRPYNLTEKSAYFQAIYPHRPFRTTIIRTCSLAEIMDVQPTYPEFWQSVAVDDQVSEVVNIQDTKGELALLPNIALELPDENTCRILCQRPTNTVLLLPLTLAESAYAFTEIPPVLDRGVRVAHNIYTTRGRSPFEEQKPEHSLYKEGYHTLPFAIEYKLNNPNRMYPVEVGL